MRPLLEILLILLLLTCPTLVGSSVLEAVRQVRGRPGFGWGYWGSLLGGMFVLLLFLLILTLTAGLVAGADR